LSIPAEKVISAAVSHILAIQIAEP